MTLAQIAARLRQMADRIEALPPVTKNVEMADEFVPKFVVNAFVDLKLIDAFGFNG
jgi:hypothetical protein